MDKKGIDPVTTDKGFDATGKADKIKKKIQRIMVYLP